MLAVADDIIKVEGLKNYLSGHWVHNGLNLTVKRGEITAVIGSSGCGKTTLLRTILMLRRASAGTIKVFDTDISRCSEKQAQAVRARWGVMFQGSALFSSLTVKENIIFPIREHTQLTRSMQDKLALLKMALVGLDLDASIKYPAELSGGMQKRAALARAIALDAELLFLDEPTAGLDPKSAGGLNELVLHLSSTLGLSFVIVTHDLDTLWRVPDRVVFMGEGVVLAVKPMAELVKDPHPLIQSYFNGVRTKRRGYDS